jgi:A/G-specific adenine glycosylase
LKKAAQTVMGQYDGIFPMDYESVLTLPGIGEYTAGAICSICYDLPTPAVDGNVLRVISRIADDATPVGDPKPKIQIRESLEQVYPTEAGAFTQALMELGATLCGPNWKPRCKECPCREFCLGYLNGTAESLPVKAPKKQKRIEEYTVFLLSCGELMAIEKRPETGLLADLWQFPNVKEKLEPDQALEFLTKIGLKPRELLRQAERKHVFTHIRWEMRGYWVEVDSPEGGFRWLPPEELAGEAALPTAFRQFLESH